MNTDLKNKLSVISAKPTFWGKWFGSIKVITLSSDKIICTTKKNVCTEYELSNITHLPRIEHSFFGTKIIFRYNNNDIVFTKLSKIQAIALFDILIKQVKSNVQKILDKILNIFATYAEYQYLRDSNVGILEQDLNPFFSWYETQKAWFIEQFDSKLNERLNYISFFFPLSEANIKKIRKVYENHILQKRKHFFDVIESNPLTEQQRLAVIRNNDINMVLAAAGTGKTSVMVAKALDLIDSGTVQGNEILILAYNRAAAKELTQRLKERSEKAGIPLSRQPFISTFHTLGRQIIKNCGYSVYLSKFEEDSKLVDIWLNQWIENYIRKSSKNLKTFLRFSFHPADPLEFQTQEEYECYIRDNEYRTLQGERVRGYQELLIANWLFLNNVPYKYEARYCSKRRIEIGIDYKPDFYLGNGIYLEHFGIDRKGRTRIGIDAKKYNENIIEKRNLHNECGTTLLETYHYNWTEQTLYSRLEELLKQQSIPLTPKTQEEIIDALKKLSVFERNQSRYSKCLKAIRTERLNHEQIVERLQKQKISHASEYATFLMEIHDAYVEELYKANEIDFDDMILQSERLINSGKFRPFWKHILVDEFQDISMARLELLRAIYSKGPHPVWTVVGDDWQSIYRFSGGKLEITTRFDSLIGKHSLTKLEKTYRYNNSIADTAGRFIMANPEQYKKNVETHTKVGFSCVHLHDNYYNGVRDVGAKTLQIFNEIRSIYPNSSIAILARYNYLLREARDKIKNKKNVHFWTFHGSKGLEADYCILLGFSQGKLGFPNQNREEAVVEALLPTLDPYPHSEERRLFYVALTRAKKECYIIADADSPSEFINELLSPEYDIDVMSEKFEKKNRDIFKCPNCSTGYFVKKNSSVSRNGQAKEFYTCSSWPLCGLSPRVCTKCGSPSVDEKTQSICQNPICGHTMPICDKCGRPMVLRQGKYGQFFGCSGYGIKGDSCSNIRKIKV